MVAKRALLGALATLLCLPSAAWSAEGGAAKKRVKVAVLDAKVGGQLDARAFEGVASMMATRLNTKRPDLKVINSGDIRTMIGFEREKQLLGCSETNCMAEIGGALGVEYILGTEASKNLGKYLLTISLLDVARSEAVKRVSKMTGDEGKLIDLCVEAVDEIALAVPGKDGEAPAVAVVEPKPEPEPAAQATTRTSAVSPAVSWALVAVGAVVAGGGGGCLGYSYSLHSDYQAGKFTKAEAGDKVELGKTLSTTGVIGLSVGAAALVAGVVTLFIPGSGPAQVGIAPTPGGAQASIAFQLP